MSAPDRSEFDRLFALRVRQLAVAVVLICAVAVVVALGVLQ